MSSTYLSGGLIEIYYRLFEQVDEDYVPVTSERDRAIERALADADTNKRVQRVGDQAGQSAALHQYMLTVPFELPVFGHTLDLDHPDHSIWDSDANRWIWVLQGASIVYPVVPVETPSEPALFLAVWTKGAVGGPPAGATGKAAPKASAARKPRRKGAGGETDASAAGDG